MHLQRRVVFLISQMWMFVLHMCREYINGKRGRMLLDCSLHTFKNSRPTKMTFVLHRTNQITKHRKPHSLPECTWWMSGRQLINQYTIQNSYVVMERTYLYEHRLFISFRSFLLKKARHLAWINKDWASLSVQ